MVRTIGSVVVVVLTLLLTWPALYNRQPFFYPDTSTYIRGADAGIQHAFGQRSIWSLPDPTLGGGTFSGAPHQKSLSSIADKTVLQGRSPYYGALLYLGELGGNFWLTVVAQAVTV